MARQLFIWIVLLLAPFTGVRVVCVDPPAEPRQSRQLTAAEDCDRFCARPPKPQAKRGGFNCALQADACSQLLTATVAVMPTAAFVAYRLERTAVEAAIHPPYVAPALSLDSPPPKA